jgi:DNA-binding CsgD family transcriptional regulator/PAS domain-containing protein
MATRDDLLATLESIHAAGLDERQWPAALSAVTKLLGAVAATFEEFAKTPLQHRAFHTFGLPPLRELEYVDQYIACSPRIPAGLTWRTGRVAWDYQILDEAAMRRDVFYSEFLPRCGLRYSIAAVLVHTPDEFTVVAAQRSPKQGHVDRGDIRLMRHLLPHMQQAHDVAARLRGNRSVGESLGRTLDWLADGVALLGADGTVVYANESLQALARRRAGIRLGKRGIEFADPEAQRKFNSAVASVLRLKSGQTEEVPAADFVAARSAHPQPYLVSVRPLFAAHVSAPTLLHAVAIAFVRDPLSGGTAATGTLRELFGLTIAEAALARALQSGVTLTEYARQRALSLNTVYTHLRRLREKTGCSRMAELIHRLNELRLPLRRD